LSLQEILTLGKKFKPLGIDKAPSQVTSCIAPEPSVVDYRVSSM